MINYKKILVVDDDEDVAYFVSKFLEAEGYKTRTAFDGQKALNILGREAFGIILLDLMMPVLDGMSVLGKIKQLKNKPIIIVFTGKRITEEEKKVINKEAFGIIYKPYKLKDIRRLLKRASAEIRKRKR